MYLLLVIVVLEVHDEISLYAEGLSQLLKSRVYTHVMCQTSMVLLYFYFVASTAHGRTVHRVGFQSDGRTSSLRETHPGQANRVSQTLIFVRRMYM